MNEFTALDGLADRRAASIPADRPLRVAGVERGADAALRYRGATGEPLPPSRGPSTRLTVRFYSGAVEHRYGQVLPQVGDRFEANGKSGFVTRVQVDEDGGATIDVGTPAPPGVSWADVTAARDAAFDDDLRPRILDAAYELFAERGVRAVAVEDVAARAGIAADTLEEAFPTKDGLVLAFLQRREQRWTREFVEAEARRRGATPRERLLAIFDVFDDWFQESDFEGCSFITALVETGGTRTEVGRASADHLEYIRTVVRRLAEEAGVADVDGFARSWHILMKGSIVSALEGDLLAARRARAMAEDLLARHLEPSS